MPVLQYYQESSMRKHYTRIPSIEIGSFIRFIAVATLFYVFIPTIFGTLSRKQKDIEENDFF